MSHHHHQPPHADHIPAPSIKPTDYAATNKDHFNAIASTQDHPHWLELARRSAQAMREHYDFDEDSTILLDFACNTGLLSRELAPYAKQIVGVDISQSAVDIFNERASNQGLSDDEMRAVCVELKGKEGELGGMKFDIITCASSYHHFESINDITRILAYFLKPGGALLVVDVTRREDGIGSKSLFPEEFQHIVPHKDGLTEESMRSAFEHANLCSFTIQRLTTIKIHQTEGIMFIAKGLKPL